MIITIDGPSGSGKGTMSRLLAEHYNLSFLDTGLLYRAVAGQILTAGIKPENIDKVVKLAEDLDFSMLEKEKLRSDEIAVVASKIATIPGVRKALLQAQRTFAQSPGVGKNGVILDGRDVGTTICPEADVKFFLTSAVEVRATRRHKELQNLGIESI